MRTLVTGGRGYVGRAVVAELVAHGHAVDVLGRDNADLGDPAALGPLGTYDAVCHLAAFTRVRDSFADPLSCYAVNLGGTINLLKALDRGEAPVRLVFLSTAAVYGGREGTLTEETPPRPESPYASSKLAAEWLIGRQAALGRLGAVTLRCFNIAGSVAGRADQDPTRLIPNAVGAASGRLGPLVVNGDGSTVREYVHVADVATACRLALARAVPGTHEVYNLGTGTGLSVSDVVATLERVTGRELPVVHGPARDEPRRLVADPTLARDRLGWTPRHSTPEEILRSAWDAELAAQQRPR
jgi:UDP-glucose 4-epimerase